jgi:hypothetical protein
VFTWKTTWRDGDNAYVFERKLTERTANGGQTARSPDLSADRIAAPNGPCRLAFCRAGHLRPPLEHSLNPRERHKLGAHCTPRAYVERLAGLYPGTSGII